MVGGAVLCGPPRQPDREAVSLKTCSLVLVSGTRGAQGVAEMRRRSFASEGRSRSDGEADRKGPRVALCCSSEFILHSLHFLDGYCYGQNKSGMV